MIEIDDDDLQTEDATPEIVTLRQRAHENAAREAYLASLKQRPCGFHKGAAGKPCIRPTCLASWEEHYGAPPQDKQQPRTRRAAHKGAR